MTPIDKIKQDIKNNDFERMYIIYGEENYLREYYKKQIISSFENDGFFDFNGLFIDGEALKIEEVITFFDSLPMMSPRKLLLINDLNLMKLSSELKDKFLPLLEDIPEYLTVVFTYSALDFKPDKRLSIWKNFEKNAVICNVEKASKSDLVAWIKRRFRALEKNITTENAEYLMFLCGELMTNLVSEIAKIASGTKTQEIEKRHIDLLASPTLEAQVFEISDKIAKKEYKEALEILNTLLMLKYEPIAISAVLSKQIGRMYTVKLALNANKNEQYIMKACGFKSPYPAKILSNSVRKCSLTWLRKAVKLSIANDLELKSSIPDNERKLYLFLCMIAQEV